ncbi:MAG: inositol-3-phosphate synthase, partial [Bacillota bacterium]
MPQREIRVAIAGVGNCANSLVQGLFYYRHQSSGEVPGLMHQVMGGYAVTDLMPVAAFDVDARKVGKDLSEAIFAPPNCAYEFADVPKLGVEVMMGPVLDGVPPHLAKFVEVADKEPVNVAKVLKETRA